jgi:hypothetical protein
MEIDNTNERGYLIFMGQRWDFRSLERKSVFGRRSKYAESRKLIHPAGQLCGDPCIEPSAAIRG